MDGPTDPAPATDGDPVAGAVDRTEAVDRAVAPPSPAEPRQRWRLTFARDPVPADQVGRAALDAWQAALTGCGLPVAGLEAGGGGRARIAFAAPLPAAASGEAELADVWLLERLPSWRVRESLAGRLPSGHGWIGIEDIWLGAPALAGRVVAADWRLELAGSVGARDRLADAAARLLAAGEVPRIRVKGTTEKRYDLRPLIASIAVDDDVVAPAGGGPGDRIALRVRTRIHPELGAGRPDEVVAALADLAGTQYETRSTVRERLVLADDAAASLAPQPGAGRLDPRVRLPARPRRR